MNRTGSRYLRLSKVNFFGFPKGIDFMSVIATKVAQSECNSPNLRNSLGGVLYYFKDSLSRDKQYVIKQKEKNRYLLFYGAYNCRKDHLRTFTTFSEKFPDADVTCATPCKKEFTIGCFLKSIPLFFVWLLQMLFNGLPLYECLNSIRFVQICYLQNRLLQSLLEKEYSFIVVYYDASPDENYFVQLCKKKNILTMTLQHGIFARKSTIHTISDTAFELSESISDYYLAWNLYTKDEAVKVGLDADKVVVLGAPKYINTKEPSKPYKSDNKYFGVILNNSAFNEHNKHLVDMANQISDITGYKYILRYHPEMKGDEYKKMYGSGFLKKDNNNHTIAEYACSVSYTIISSSSVFVDLLLLKHPTYRLKVFDEDTYSTVEFNSFATANEFVMLLEKEHDDNIAFDYLCNSYNIYNNYRTFFDKFLKTN